MSTWNLVWNKDLCRCNYSRILKWNYLELRVGLESNDCWEDKDTRKKAMWGWRLEWKGYKSRNAKYCQKPPEAGKDSPLEPSEGAMVFVANAWFWTSSFQNCETIHFCVFKPPVCGHLLRQHWETNTSAISGFYPLDDKSASSVIANGKCLRVFSNVPWEGKIVPQPHCPVTALVGWTWWEGGAEWDELGFDSHPHPEQLRDLGKVAKLWSSVSSWVKWQLRRYLTEPSCRCNEVMCGTCLAWCLTQS